MHRGVRTLIGLPMLSTAAAVPAGTPSPLRLPGNWPGLEPLAS
jgi:hypothetical protein